MDLSVIIVNWKVKDLLRRCLASVYRETKGIGFEVFVVDNDSKDGSAEMVAVEFPQAHIMANNRNVGFAAGNNPAIAASDGDIVLLLNPDTEIVDGALQKMVAYMRENPHVGILGPRLVGADGALQPSVRRFPTLASQVLIMLKLHHVFPGLKPLTSYFAADFDYAAASPTDQVMGAAFMIRRSVLEAIGALDERFFIWFEEVDFCKRAKDAGFQVWYWPGATVRHNGGESFGQVFGPKKQRYFNGSLAEYFRKHHGVLAWAAITFFRPLSMLLAWAAAAAKRQRSSESPDARTLRETFKWSLLLIVLFELVSLFGFLLPAFSSAAFLIIVACTAVLAWVRFDLAALVLLAELFIGSQGGYMVAFGHSSGLFVSLRLGLFLALVGIWAAKTVSDLLKGGEERVGAMEWFRAMRARRAFAPYVLLLAVLLLGVIRGVVGGNDLGDVFFDANGFAFLGLFPAFIVAFSTRGSWLRAGAVMAAAIAVTVFKALGVLYFFSHRLFYTAQYIYVWIRDTRVGEITIMTADYYRVFFQSQLFPMAAIFVAVLLAAYLRSWKGPAAKALIALTCWSMVSMVLSLSRSFWFGGVAAGAGLLALLIWGRASVLVWKRALLVGFGSIAAAVLLIGVVYSFPFPRKTGDLSLASLLGQRAFSLSGEAAANSRWALLPRLWEAGMRHPVFGSGLGTTVTYTTSDPRLLADNPTGEYTTFAFEWGYHDLWVKFGLAGIAAYAWFIAVLLLPLVAAIRDRRAAFREPSLAVDGQDTRAVVAAGLVLSVVAVLATNVFSPYLNHPLGIGFLMLVGAMGVRGAFDIKNA